MGNTSSAELIHQGVLLGEKLRKTASINSLTPPRGGTEEEAFNGNVHGDLSSKQHHQLVAKVTSQGLSLKKMQRIQKQIEFEYPFLSNIYESILVTDNCLPDCPIVWANDQFERMTLYPKEDIIGRNCRFLQGEYTNPITVHKIRDAVKSGRGLDVEILNYRRDGVAFWNRFRILPVHKKGKTSGEVTHFIAIQKDVTLLKDFASQDPVEWSAPEVAMWLETNDYGHFGRTIVVKGIDGKHLFRIDMAELAQVLGQDADPAQKEAIWKLICDLRTKNKQLVAEQWEQAKHRIKATNIVYQSPMGDNINEDVPDFWNRDKASEDYRLSVKVHFPDFEKPVIFLARRGISYIELSKKIEKLYGRPMKLFFTDQDGDKNQIDENDDVEAAILTSRGGTVCLRAERVKYKLNKKSFELYEPLPVSILLTDLGGEIMFANQCAQKLVNLSTGRQLEACNIREILECQSISRAEDIKEAGGDTQGYEGFVWTLPPPPTTAQLSPSDASTNSSKRKVCFYVTKGKSGRFVFTLLPSPSEGSTNTVGVTNAEG